MAQYSQTKCFQPINPIITSSTTKMNSHHYLIAPSTAKKVPPSRNNRRQTQHQSSRQTRTRAEKETRPLVAQRLPRAPQKLCRLMEFLLFPLLPLAVVVFFPFFFLYQTGQTARGTSFVPACALELLACSKMRIANALLSYCAHTCAQPLPRHAHALYANSREPRAVCNAGCCCCSFFQAAGSRCACLRVHA